MNNPNATANLVHFRPGNKAARPSPYPERALRIARRATPEAVNLAISCMRDTLLPWPERLQAIKLILAEGLPRKRDAFEAIFAAAGDGFIEVRFVRPGEQSEHANGELVDAKPNGHGTFRISLDDGE